MATFEHEPRWQFRNLSLAKWSALLIVGGIFLAWLYSDSEWAADGTLHFPVRVFVFDARSGIPVAKARVGILRSPPLTESRSHKAHIDRSELPTITPTSDIGSGTTGSDGMSIVDVEFQTGTSDQHPTPRAHVASVWVHVEADGYGGIVVPVRHESQPVAILKERGEILVPIGLLPSQ